MTENEESVLVGCEIGCLAGTDCVMCPLPSNEQGICQRRIGHEQGIAEGREQALKEVGEWLQQNLRDDCCLAVFGKYAGERLDYIIEALKEGRMP